MSAELTALLASIASLTKAYHVALADPTTGVDGIDATIARLLLATHAGSREVTS